MQRQEFKTWLLEYKQYDIRTTNTRIGNCSTLEHAYGNLDEHYAKDRLSSILKWLKYSKQDERAGAKPHPPLQIEGDFYTGLATLRQALNRYSEFKLQQEISAENTEDNTLSNVSITVNLPTDSKSQVPSENKNTLLLLPIKNLRNKTFEIGSYQRGYKWSKKEILELLNDIHSYDESKGLYCLQPLVLKPLNQEKEEIVIENNTYNIFTKNEVVDGQQRTTTLFLLLQYFVHKGWIEKEYLYNIDFKTRERSGIFLKEYLPLIFDFSLDAITEKELKAQEYHDLKSVNTLWSAFIKEYSNYNNVDVYHFFVVTSYFIRWIEVFLSEEAQRKEFIYKLLESIKVIWYSLDSSQGDSQITQVFLNNNKGKIGLTSSELIKALFILDIKKNETVSISNIQINQFASEWDSVEKQLQEDNFWYFIQPNEEKYQDGTRIDYLFDLLLEKPSKADAFFSYRHFEKASNDKKSIIKSWEKVIQLYYKLLNWYQDSEIFHFVGYLTNSNIRTVARLLRDNKGKTKETLKRALKDIIIKDFKKKGKTKEGKTFLIYNTDILDYKDYYKETRKVLLLYNVFYYLDNMAGHKFPFELFVKEKWSIEHIIPQTPKDIEDIVVYIQWFKDMIAHGELEVDTVIEKIKAYSSVEDLKKNKELKVDLDKIIDESENVTHSLNNLVLLDRNTNSALGHELFNMKRNRILQFAKDGHNDKEKPVFIPIETLNAFNKTFSKKVNIENWTKEDGDNYVEAIKERLKEFLPLI
ncbi:DUF262 domain-containing protein [uncultured Kordia sp.]|uniref:DUF262 domain-containing protein n=1 Tax=uncultured Kordia sp. TaxID=507699 RepID=UPI0026306463|nr:DUF262 domain-containing protein [uncultured Kordia sp.]